MTILKLETSLFSEYLVPVTYIQPCLSPKTGISQRHIASLPQMEDILPSASWLLISQCLEVF